MFNKAKIWFKRKILHKKATPHKLFWDVILEEIYKNSPHEYGENVKITFNDDKHPLARKVGMTGDELMLEIEFLERQGLIKKNVNVDMKNVPYHMTLQLTEKGFDVIFSLEKHRQSGRIQGAIVIFTAMVVFTGAIRYIAELSNISPRTVLIIYLVFFMIVGFLGLILMKKW